MWIKLMWCSSTIRDKIIPHAVSWFTGEAAQDDEFEDIEEDDDEDEEGDEDEDDEDEDDEEEDEDEDDDVDKGKSRKKVMKSNSNLKKLKSLIFSFWTLKSPLFLGCTWLESSGCHLNRRWGDIITM